MKTYRPRTGARIVVAMSGGVDSSVAAAWLKTKNYDVLGVSLKLHDASAAASNKFGTCCTQTDVNDARMVAEKIKIPFYVSDMEAEFKKNVIDNFVTEYLAGRTPNPCVRCNENVKFSRLLDWALDLGADYLVTGHYARVSIGENSGSLELHQAVHLEKDQSYFLFGIREKDLGKCFFPLGELSKHEVRDLARRLGLHVAEKPESQEICFVPSDDYAGFIEKSRPDEIPNNNGEIVDNSGRVVGFHKGVHRFTIGQKKGLGLHTHEPLCVIKLDAPRNQVVVGPEALLYRHLCTASHPHWINEEVRSKACFTAKIRSRAQPTSVCVTPLGNDRIEVKFEQPQRSITPGQAIVFYDGTRVAGGAWIDG
jgi:tRNA-specific 2-thiouridylase